MVFGVGFYSVIIGNLSLIIASDSDKNENLKVWYIVTVLGITESYRRIFKRNRAPLGFKLENKSFPWEKLYRALWENR